MFGYIISFAIPITFVFLQTTLQSLMAINGIYPEIVLICLLYYSNSRNPLYGQITGLTIGIIIDFLSLAPLGFFAFIYTFIGFLSGSTMKKLYSDSVITPILMTAVFLALKELLVFILAGIFTYSNGELSFFTSQFFLQMLYTALVSPILFALFRLVDNLLLRGQKRRPGYAEKK